MWRFVVFACTFATAFACSCFPSHPQQQFCRSQFVLLSKVVKAPIVKPWTWQKNFQDQVYTLHVIKIFRGNKKVKRNLNYDKKTHRVKLYTPSRFISCSIYLRKNKVYLLGGRFSSDGKLRAGGCSLVRLWSAMSQRQKVNVVKHYKPNCMCSIQTCRRKHKCTASKKTVCKFNYSSPDYRCTIKSEYCKFSHASRTCEWRQTAHYKQCLQNTFP